uniref:Putative Phage integrase n=1 Tax=mine drainage metagenome TaxID=410659 RepID=E6PW66_9ZZZZ
MPLTDTAIRNAKPGPKAIKLFDGQGLYLEVTPAGGKVWRLKYSFQRKEKRLSFGAYPIVTLKDAREKRDEAKRHLADGRDPGAVKQAEKARAFALAADSFEVVARDWIERHLSTKAASHRDKVVRRLERDVFPYLGRRPVAEITAPDILTVLRRIDARGVLETAHRAQQNIGQVIRYAILTGRATNDPTPALRGALPAYVPTHMASPADDPAAVGAILRSLDAFKGGPVVAAAIKLLPMLFCRPGELRTMRWEQVNLETAEWRYIVSKTGTDHLVPLSHQAVALLTDLRLLTGHLPAGWVFIGGRTPTQPMSDAAINAAYRRLGIDTKTELTGHGWRSVARTFLHERLGYEPAVIEHQLAHAVPDSLGTAYNRTRFIATRRKMMQDWSDYLDKLKAGADIIPIRGAA